MFLQFKNQLRANFGKLTKNKTFLFYKDINRDKVWELYLDGFSDPVERQDNNCNCCKQFFRQFSGIVTIENNMSISIWDLDLETIDEKFKQSVINIKKYIDSLPVTNVFVNTFRNLGTDKSRDSDRNVYWDHLHLELPEKMVYKSKGRESVDTVKHEYRENKNVLKRSLDELTIDACETVLDLIQNGLYRGKEYEHIVQQFLEIKKKYLNVPEDQKDNFCWSISMSLSSSLCHVRNTAIGALLIDLSNGDDMDRAVTIFEKLVAPENFKRPKPIITTKLVEKGEKKFEELGFKESLNRRYATADDVSINDLIFVDRSSELTDIFSVLQKEVQVNPKSLSKIEEISIEDFISNVVPQAKSIEVLVENNHLTNMVCLLTAVDKSSKSMFKWNNQLSWFYTNGVADSIKERVKAAGGNVDAELRVSLSWYNYDDLDLHVIEPNGNKIYFSRKSSNISDGRLDVDMNAGGGHTRKPVENIVWTKKTKMLEGVYRVEVNNFAQRESSNSGFIVEVECNGEVFNFEYKTSPRHQSTVHIADLVYSKTKGLVINGDVKSSVISKEKWGIKTNHFVKVKSMALSPNYWQNTIGNKHYMFFLENCICDENPRPFFNEFLVDDLTSEKRLTEAMASKLQVQPSNEQLSGIGFSETQPNHLIVRVEGSFKRNLKIKFNVNNYNYVN